MKKFLTVLLTLCLIASLSAMFAVGASAEEIEVTVGQKFEWNDQSEDNATQRAWRTGGGVSPDGLWKYQFYALEKGIYGPVVLSSSAGGYAWAKEPGNTGLGYARARENGKNFHPGETADIVKVFTCPSGGTIAVDTTIARVTEWVSGKNTATSFRVYLEDQLVYPTSGEYVSIVSTAETPINFEVEVQKNQRLFIHIGCIDGDQNGDAVIMSNTVTYKSVNDTSAEVSQGNTLTFTVPSNEIGDLTLTDKDDTGAGPANSNVGSGAEESSMGLIIAVVAGVAVVAVVVVVIVIKKKQQ